MRDVLPLVTTLKPAALARLTARVQVEGSPPDAARRAVAGYLRAEQQLGRVQADADIDAAAMLLTGALHELALFGTPDAESGRDDALVGRVVGMVMRALT